MRLHQLGELHIKKAIESFLCPICHKQLSRKESFVPHSKRHDEARKYNPTDLVDQDCYATSFSTWKTLFDVLPWFTKGRQKCVYDPFYMNGSSKKIFKKIGVENVLHQNKNFFTTHRRQQYDVIITNPPFSILMDVFAELYFIDKPFVTLVPSSTLYTCYFFRLFGASPHIQIVHLVGKPKFENNRKEISNAGYRGTVFICFKCNLERDVTFVKE